MDKPNVFIASSVESLDIAYAIQENLEYSAEITVWSQGVFHLTRTALSTLLKTLENYDFAIFIFTPDDVIKMKNETSNVTRDNVIFELGLFMGHLGENRTFIVTPRDTELHLPSDLLGTIPATYDPNRKDKNLVAALGPACTKIKREMEQLGILSNNVAETLSPYFASGLTEELKSEVNKMLYDQGIFIQSTFNKFEKRLNDISKINQSSPKSSVSKIAEQITEKISQTSKALIYNIKNVHLTMEQYKALDQIPHIHSALEELRENNLLVVLSGYNSERERVPVFWFAPNFSKIIVAILNSEIDLDKNTDLNVKKALKSVGYKL